MKIKLLFLFVFLPFFNLNAQIDFQDHLIGNQNLLDSALSVHINDMDGDGDMDILASTYSKVVWYENTNGLGNFGQQQIISTSGASTVYAVDMNNDGKTDVLFANGAYVIGWHENNGSGNFGSPQIIENYLLALETAQPFDIDFDGDIDVVATSAGDPPFAIPGKIVWYENNGQGNFGSDNVIDVLQYEFWVHANDIDGDNDMDVVLGSDIYSSSELVWYANNGQGNFNSSTTINPDPVYAVHTADINNDSKIDVVSSSSTGIAWYENTDGLGIFGTKQIIDSNPAEIVHSVDIHGDNDMDLLASSYSTGVFWYENNGVGNFGVRQTISNNSYGYPGDIDGDGDNDIVAWSQDKIVWHENMNGLGDFEPPQIVMTSTDYEDIYPSDIDSDGDMDVAFASSTGDKIGWYENMDGLGNI